MEITIRYTRSTVHLQGLAESSKGSGMDYAVSACSALSRSASRMGTRTTHETVKDALKAAQDFAKAMNLKVCKNCLKAAEANIEPETKEEEKETVAPEYRGHKISCPFFGPDYDHCNCGTESEARVIVEDMESSEWDTMSSFGDGEHYTQYQENWYTHTARVLVAGREVVSPRYDTESVYNQYNARYNRFMEVIEN